MSRDALEGLYDRWTSDAAFRERLRSDPEGAIRESGAELDDDELTAFRAVDWKLNDEELEARYSKSYS